MKTCIKNCFLLPTLLAVLGWLATVRVPAQTFQILHQFTYTPSGTDGAYPVAGLTGAGTTLFGTCTFGGGGDSEGVVFSIGTNGAGFKTLATFPDPGDYPDYQTNVVGFNPYAGVTLANGLLYGAAANGGPNATGTLFAVSTNGTGFSVLFAFDGFPPVTYPPATFDGANPSATLILSGSILYGMAPEGGTNVAGTIFSLPAGGGVMNWVHAFNSSGFEPLGGVTLSGDKLYGTTSSGVVETDGPTFGQTYPGTIFSINTDGTGYTNLYIFTGGNDGGTPQGNLLVSGNTIYGTASGYWPYDSGTVFSIKTDGTGFTTLHAFSALNNNTNVDGAIPVAGLVLSGNLLYGVAQLGGANGSGTVFAVDPATLAFTVLHTFGPLDENTFTNTDGANPTGQLFLSGNTLYGTAQNGGWGGYGTIFSLPASVAVAAGIPELSIALTSAKAIISWPTNLTGDTLQTTTNLSSAAVWNVVTPAPVVTGGNYTVTNPVTGSRRFYRLSQ